MKRTYLTIIFILLLCAMVGSQFLYDKAKASGEFVEPLVLKPEIVKILDLGLHNSAADLEWLSAIQYYGGGESEGYPKLKEYLNTATDLDPKFSYPYAFGSLILPGINEVDSAIALGEKGVKNSESDYRIPYYLATTYFLSKKDNGQAAKYFDIAANTPGAPAGIQRAAANFGSRSDIRDQTKAIWVGIYESTKDEVVKERAKNYITHFEILTFLEQAAKIYKEKNGSWPTTTSEMMPAILKSIPVDPFGYTYRFDENGRAIVE